MSFLQYYYSLEDEDGIEQPVLCPFPHYSNSVAYLETNPSAHVNLDKKVFHCKSCGRGLNDQMFMKEVLELNMTSTIKLHKAFNNDEDIFIWKQTTTALEDSTTILSQEHYASSVFKELDLATVEGGEAVAFPVFMYDKLIDIRTYRPGGKPKVRSRRGATAGLIIPFDIWRNTSKTKWTVICAGEKDMTIARSNGFNAITITGGEHTIPISLTEFKDRNVAVVYDNDDAGIKGAIKLCTTLKKVAKTVKNITKFHKVCSSKGEDITDYFIKYNRHRQDLINCINNTEVFTIPDKLITRLNKTLTLYEASNPINLGKITQSSVQVVATTEQTFKIPTAAIAEKYKQDEHANLYKGELREWNLEDDNIEDVMYLMDHRLRTKDIRDNIIHQLLKIPYKEKYIRLKTNLESQIVHKAYITDLFNSTSETTIQMEYLVYSIGCKLESGKKYTIAYKLVPNPHAGQELVVIVISAKPVDDTVSGFKITEETKEHLDIFYRPNISVEDKVNDSVKRVKGLLGYDGNDTLIKILDLAYHTPLKFKLGSNVERAYLDTIIVTESRVGKSSTAKALLETYGLGTFISLAGNSATVAGLIGGSNKIGGGYQTRAGLIPQNHKGLIIFEEFGKCNSNIVKELTDIRSSNEVRIARVSGSLTLPAMVRMIALSNVKSQGHMIKPIASYPNGISIISELIGTAEDIARYDIMLVVGEKGNINIDPYWKPMEPYAPEVYKSRIRWIWSRSVEQIKISEPIGHFIIKQANNLNKLYDSHIKIFGTEAWKKLTRIAVAVAGYCVSTDETYENLIVTQEHVEYAVKIMQDIYDNNTFRLKEYVTHEKKYTTIDADGVNNLQRLYTTSPGLLLQLEQETTTNRATLLSAAGLSQEQYNGLTNSLLRNMFIRISNNEIRPTERFRKGMALIDRTQTLGVL